MSDIAVVWIATSAALDLALVDDDLSTDDGLATAGLLSLFLDRRAEVEDDLPVAGDVRGWWGDQFSEVEGDREGSRLWLLERGKVDGETPGFANDLVSAALAWMVADGVAERVEVDAFAEGGALCVPVTVFRPDDEDISFVFRPLWEGTFNAV